MKNVVLLALVLGLVMLGILKAIDSCTIAKWEVIGNDQWEDIQRLKGELEDAQSENSIIKNELRDERTASSEKTRTIEALEETIARYRELVGVGEQKASLLRKNMALQEKEMFALKEENALLKKNVSTLEKTLELQQETIGAQKSAIKALEGRP